MTPCSRAIVLPTASARLPSCRPSQPRHRCGCRLLVLLAVHGRPKSPKNLQRAPESALLPALWLPKLVPMHASPLLWSHQGVCRGALCYCTRRQAPRRRLPQAGLHLKREWRVPGMHLRAGMAPSSFFHSILST